MRSISAGSSTLEAQGDTAVSDFAPDALAYTDHTACRHLRRPAAVVIALQTRRHRLDAKAIEGFGQGRKALGRDERVPEGLAFGAILPEPRFTPATKNDSGHDENISRSQLAEMVGYELAGQLETVSQALFQFGTERFRQAGLVLVDTKFEFGMVDGELTLIDEVLTPDCCRLWALSDAETELQPHGFDKQPVRDYLVSTGWDRLPPAPALPETLLRETRGRYLEVCRRITGIDL